MKEFIKLTQHFRSFGLSAFDMEKAIRHVCDFFHIPMPRMIQDLTNVQNGQTMFMNWHPGLYEDDVLCYNMQEFINMKVDSKEAFSLVMTHECAHRVLQNTQLPGINNGRWCSRALFIRRGKYKAIEMRNNNILLSIPNLLSEFMIYRQENLAQIHQYQRKFYDF